MVNSSKILTVSYSTLSYTLEGFDDPFGAMKAIVGYARDLACQDPDLGAESALHDTAMLREIAQRHTLKHVDARVEDQSIILRQSDQDRDITVEGSAPAPIEDMTDATADPVIEDAFTKMSRLREASRGTDGSEEFLEDEHASGSEKADLSDLEDLNEFDELISNHALTTDKSQAQAPEDRKAMRQRVKDRIAINAKAERRTETALPPILLEDAPAATDETLNVSRVLRVKRKRQEDAKDALSVTATNTPVIDHIEAEDAVVATEQPSNPKPPSENREQTMATDDTPIVAPMPPLSLDTPLHSTKPHAAGNKDNDASEAQLHDKIATLLSSMEEESRVDARRERRAHIFTDQKTDADDTAIERILAQTNDHMDSHDASRRRNAIGHLKAAVQAAIADKSEGGDGRDEDTYETQFRSDLEQAKQDKPTPENTATSTRDRGVRPQDDNTNAPRSRQDASPETGSASTAYTDDQLFAAYVQHVNATDTEGYLRAAAVFASLSSGQPHFSRSEVVGLVAGLEVARDITREDVLRAFGRLLRDGVIIKVAQGSYSLAKDSQDDLQTA